MRLLLLIVFCVFFSPIYGAENEQEKIIRAKDFVKSTIVNSSFVKFQSQDTIVNNNIVTLTFLFKDNLDDKYQRKTVSVYLYE